MKSPKITFIGAGSTIFVKNILGDVFHKPAFKGAQIALMDIDEIRLEESHLVVSKLMESSGATGTITCHLNQKEALQGADFVTGQGKKPKNMLARRTHLRGLLLPLQ